MRNVIYGRAVEIYIRAVESIQKTGNKEGAGIGMLLLQMSDLFVTIKQFCSAGQEERLKKRRVTDVQQQKLCLSPMLLYDSYSIVTACETTMDRLRGPAVGQKSGGPAALWEGYVTWTQTIDAVDMFGLYLHASNNDVTKSHLWRVTLKICKARSVLARQNP